VVATLAAAALAGIGVAGVGRRLEARSPRAASLVRGAALALALASVPWAMRVPVPLRTLEPTAAAPLHAWLARAPDGPVVEVPFHDFDGPREGVDVEARRQRHSAAHWKPLLGGYSGYVPPSYAVVSALARALPDARALALLSRTTGVRWIVVH